MTLALAMHHLIDALVRHEFPGYRVLVAHKVIIFRHIVFQFLALLHIIILIMDYLLYLGVGCWVFAIIHGERRILVFFLNFVQSLSDIYVRPRGFEPGLVISIFYSLKLLIHVDAEIVEMLCRLFPVFPVAIAYRSRDNWVVRFLHL